MSANSFAASIGSFLSWICIHPLKRTHSRRLVYLNLNDCCPGNAPGIGIIPCSVFIYMNFIKNSSVSIIEITEFTHDHEQWSHIDFEYIHTCKLNLKKMSSMGFWLTNLGGYTYLLLKYNVKFFWENELVKFLLFYCVKKVHFTWSTLWPAAKNDNLFLRNLHSLKSEYLGTFCGDFNSGNSLVN